MNCKSDLIQVCNCGEIYNEEESGNRIKDFAPFTQYPWVVLVYYDELDLGFVVKTNRLFKCAGTILTNR